MFFEISIGFMWNMPLIIICSNLLISNNYLNMMNYKFVCTKELSTMKTIEWHLLKFWCLYISLNNMYIFVLCRTRILKDIVKLFQEKDWWSLQFFFVQMDSLLSTSQCLKKKNSTRYFSWFCLIYLVYLVTKIRHWKG